MTTETDAKIKDNLNCAYNIANYILNTIKNNSNIKILSTAHFKDGPNPFFNQMEQGFMLEEYYGSPYYLYTSIGQWTITGSSSSTNNDWKKIIDILKNDLGLELYQDGIQSKMGYYGPLWIITKFNQTQLPIAQRKSRNNYIEYEESKDIWQNFKLENNI